MKSTQSGHITVITVIAAALGACGAVALAAEAPKGAAPGPSPSPAATSPGECVFDPDDAAKKLGGQLGALMSELAKKKDPDCAQAQQEVSQISQQIAQTGISSPTDPTAKDLQLELMERMTAAMGTHCASALNDPSPMIYSSLYLAAAASGNPMTAYGASATLGLLGDLGNHIVRLFQRPSRVEKAKKGDDQQQAFLDHACMLYLYQHNVDDVLANSRKFAPTLEASRKDATEKLALVSQQLNEFHPCSEAGQNVAPLESKLQALQDTISKSSEDAALSAQCHEIRRSMDPNNERSLFGPVEGVSKRNCAMDAQCAFSSAPKNLDTRDFCVAWCTMKRDNLSVDANVDCDMTDDRNKQTLRDMKNRARTSAAYALGRIRGDLGDADRLAQYNGLLAQKTALEAQLKTDVAATTRNREVASHTEEPRLRDKLLALDSQIFGKDMRKYADALYKDNESKLKRVKAALESASKMDKNGKGDAQLCIDVRTAQADLREVNDRFAHFQDLCAYTGPDSKPFQDRSLSFWDASPQLRAFCTEAGKRRESMLGETRQDGYGAAIQRLDKAHQCGSL